MKENRKKNTSLRKIRIVIEVLCVTAVLLILLHLHHVHTPTILEYLRDDDISGLTGYIRGEGKIGELFLIGLQLIETVSIVLPALPVYICAGILYGKVEGILLCYVTNLAANAALFTFARKRGVSMKQFSKYMTNPKVEQLMDRVKRPDRVVLAMCLLPVIPNGTIPYLAAQTEVTFREFMRSLAIGCFPSIAFNVICGDALLTINWKIFLPLILAVIVIAVILMILHKRVTVWLEPKLRRYADGKKEP